MLELFSSGLMAIWLESAGIQTAGLNPSQLLVWQGVPLVLLPTNPGAAVNITVKQYLIELAAKGRTEANQGLWLQSGTDLLIDRQGTVPASAASLTKIATTLVALKNLKPSHQFETLIGATGPIKNGVLEGDLVITGNADPFFVWEEAIVLGNVLNQLGIRKVAGNLVIAGNFYMNYRSNPAIAGQMLKQALDNTTWKRDPTYIHQTMPKGTPKPQVAIAGKIVVVERPLRKPSLLIRHRSVRLVQILKEMNIYSNNEMAEMLATSLGGGQVVAKLAAKLAGVPPEEIQLINGSGLGVENRISPRAACAMLMAIQRYLQPHQLTIADLFPISGRDHRGTVHARQIPGGTIIKTGTLNEVSALAGVMPTRDRGLVWFAIINQGKDVDNFRKEQDLLLQDLIKQWGVAKFIPVAIAPSPGVLDGLSFLGDASRNEVVSKNQAQL